MIPYQVTSTFIGALIAGCILYLVRRDHMHGPYAIWWLCVAVAVILLGFFPSLIDRLAALLGVNYPPILAIVLGLGLLMIKMLTMDLAHSRQERNIRRLTQRVALLESNLNSLRDSALTKQQSSETQQR